MISQLGIFRNIINGIIYFSVTKKATVVIPALNEEKTIERVIRCAKQSFFCEEVIVVDDGSTDRTSFFAEKAGAKVIRLEKNRGKGYALKVGFKAAKNEVVCFIDADIPNWNSSKIDAIIKPVILKEADFVKSSFKRSSGRVTTLTAKPLMKILFPTCNFEQPLSGQFCTTKEFLQKIDIEDKYGIDIGLLIDAINHGLKVKEVFIGELTNKSKELSDLAPMAEQVAYTIAKKAGLFPEKYFAIVFCIDETLGSQYKTFLETKFKGKKQGPLNKRARRTNLIKNLAETINFLKKRKFKVFLITSFTQPYARALSKKYGFNAHYARRALKKKKTFTGELGTNKSLDNLFNEICRKNKLNPKTIIFVNESDKCFASFTKSGLRVCTKKAGKKTLRKSDVVLDSWPELILNAE